MSLAHGWSRSFSGIVQSSFLRGYLITPVAVGTRVDYYGGEVVMGWGVALWSLATFLTPWAADTSLWALLATRAMLGIAEGVALPCVNNMIARTHAISNPLVKRLYIWAICDFWTIWIPNDCTMWKSLLPVSRFSSTEDKHHHLLIYHVDLKHASWFSAVPWRVMGFMGYFGGTWSDLLTRSRISVNLNRKIMQEIARHDSGVLLGIILKTAGTLAAIVGTVGAGFFVELVGSFHGFLLLTSLLYFLSALFYNIFSTGENFQRYGPRFIRLYNSSSFSVCLFSEECHSSSFLCWPFHYDAIASHRFISDVLVNATTIAKQGDNVENWNY
ncbi:hypothetical protein D5086_017810 [Populus alba]|uniref:Uncharacterized protein n=1 Tax=Populus alba TaxID=43335 RepID=A0ACC4BN48_POPAL